MGNQPSKRSNDPLQKYPSFSRTDTGGSSKSLRSIRNKLKEVSINKDRDAFDFDRSSPRGSINSRRYSGGLNDNVKPELIGSCGGLQRAHSPAPAIACEEDKLSDSDGEVGTAGLNAAPGLEEVSAQAVSTVQAGNPTDSILIRSPDEASGSRVGAATVQTYIPLDGVNHSEESPAPLGAQNSQAQLLGLDDMIQRLLDVGYSGKPTKHICLKNAEIVTICIAVREVFLSQPALLELVPPVKIVGDVHGQYSDLIRLFELCGYPPSANFLFLGDYVDRGKQSLETILLLMCYKLKYPENFFLLRGNHECANVTRVYGFYDECKRRCNIKVWKTFIDTFNTLPIAAIVASKIFCVHGGLSPSLTHMDEIRQILRPTDVPDYGLLSDLLWSDPADTSADWEDNERGVSYCFGRNVILSFLRRHDFDLVCRAHMVVEDGYEFFNDRTLVTVFSAPNYCGEFDNFGAVMSVNEELLCSFELLKPLDSMALKQQMRKSRKPLPSEPSGEPGASKHIISNRRR